MRLSTLLLDSKDNSVCFTLSKQNFDTIFGPRTSIDIHVGGRLIGSMQYSIGANHLYIHGMENYTVNSELRFKHVGKVLFEYAFHKSLKWGCNGKVELYAIDTSPAAYYKMGFRKKGFAAVNLQKLLSSYLKTRSSQDKEAILNDTFYKFLKEDAARNLNKSLEDISFEDAIQHGLYSPENLTFAEQLSRKKQLNEAGCLSMTGIMYLPIEIIEEKKKGFLRFIPTGSHMFFSHSYAESQLKSDQLKQLLKSKKIDSSNAVELEAKITESDPRWSILLSPIGLKMMRRNYISAWYICVYFNFRVAQAIISANGLDAFEKGHIPHISQLCSLNSGLIAKTLGLN